MKAKSEKTSNSIKWGYVRSSSIQQNNEYQIEALTKKGVTKFYTEKVSGKNRTDRPELENLLEDLAKSKAVEKTLVIYELSRLARSTEDLLHILRELDEMDVKLVSVKENIDPTTPQGTLLLQMIAIINEFERKILLERQRDGIDIAKKKGAFKGRQPILIEKEDFELWYNSYMNRKSTKVKMATKLGTSEPTIRKFIEAYNDGTIKTKIRPNKKGEDTEYYYVDPTDYNKKHPRTAKPKTDGESARPRRKYKTKKKVGK